MKISDAAPIFSLPDQDGHIHHLTDYLGKWVVLYFYPKDDTPGCTTEACNFRDSMSEIEKLGMVVLGVSKDSTKSHKKFAGKYHLNFPLLSDERGIVHKDYDINSRTTYLIDPKGRVAKIYKNVSPDNHVGEILANFQDPKA